MSYVRRPFQPQYGNALLLWVYDPILRDLRFGIVAALLRVIPLLRLRVIADHLHNEVGAVPKLFAHAAGVLREHERHIGLAMLVLADPDAERSQDRGAQCRGRREIIDAIGEPSRHLLV